jgi:hypothetical protein
LVVVFLIARMVLIKRILSFLLPRSLCDTSFLDLFVSAQILNLVEHLQITPNTFPLLAINPL